MKIEKVTPADAEKLLEIYAPYVIETAITFEYTPPSVEEFRRRIESFSAKLPYLKAVDESGNVIGYAYAAPFKSRPAYDWCVETTIYIRKENRQQNVGNQLYTALENSLKKLGILNMNAFIAQSDVQTPFLTNASEKFHKKMGFTQVAKWHNCGYKFGAWFNIIGMEKFIGDHASNPPKVQFGEWKI